MTPSEVFTSDDERLARVLAAIQAGDEADQLADNSTLSKALRWSLEDVAACLAEAKERKFIWEHAAVPSRRRSTPSSRSLCRAAGFSPPTATPVAPRTDAGCGSSAARPAGTSSTSSRWRVRTAAAWSVMCRVGATSS